MQTELQELNEKLRRGDKRELARRLRVNPGKIANAFDGFLKDVGFLARLQAEAMNLLEEREALAHK